MSTTPPAYTSRSILSAFRDVQKRTFLTDATPVSIDSPRQIIGLIVINATDQDCIVTADNGDTFPAPALVISTWSLPPTLRATAKLLQKPTNGKSCNVIVTDEVTLNSTSQLATLAGAAGVNITTVALASFPPSNPTDGQFIVLLLPASFDPIGGQQIRWLLQWDASAANWKFLGGPPLFNEIVTQESTGSTAYVDLATVGPSITLPRGGNYMIGVGAWEFSGNQNLLMSYSIGGAAASDDDGAGANLTNAGGNAWTERLKIIPNPVTVTAKYKQTLAGNIGTWKDRRLKITPEVLT